MGNGLIEARISGVVADFNFNSLHEEIEPLVLIKDHSAVNNPNDRIFVSVKFNTNDNSSVLKKIEDIYCQYYSDFPFEYSLVQDEIYNLYKEEDKLKP